MARKRARAGIGHAPVTRGAWARATPPSPASARRNRGIERRRWRYASSHDASSRSARSRPDTVAKRATKQRWQREGGRRDPWYLTPTRLPPARRDGSKRRSQGGEEQWHARLISSLSPKPTSSSRRTRHKNASAP